MEQSCGTTELKVSRTGVVCRAQLKGILLCLTPGPEPTGTTAFATQPQQDGEMGGGQVLRTKSALSCAALPWHDGCRTEERWVYCPCPASVLHAFRVFSHGSIATISIRALILADVRQPEPQYELTRFRDCFFWGVVN